MKKILRESNGSALVGAVALCAIMAIGAAGLIGVTRNTVGIEADSHNDARAFMAAEAGLMVGTLIHQQNGTLPVDIVHDGINVNVSIQPALAGGNPNQMRLVSRANLPDLAYLKELEWLIEVIPPTAGKWGVYVNDGNPTHLQGFRADAVFDGPMHFNTPVTISGSDLPRFRREVSVSNVPPHRGGFGSGAMRPEGYRNNYDHGIRASVSARDLDNTFEDRFEVLNEQFSMNIRNRPAGLAVGGGGEADDPVELDHVWHDVRMPSTAAFIAGSFLRLGIDGTGTTNGTGVLNPNMYTFFEQTAANQWTPHPRNIPQAGVARTELVIEAGFNLTVRGGTMNGNVTVATRAGFDLVIDLRTTSDNNFNNEINSARNNSTSIMYDIGYNPPYTPPVTVVLPAISNSDKAKAPALINFAANHGTEERNYYLPPQDGSLLAFYSNNDLIIRVNSGRYGANNKCIITALMLAPNGQIRPDHSSNNPSESINVFGCMASNIWWQSGSSGMNLADQFRVFHDRRERNPPGIEMTGGGAGSDGQLLFDRWIERSVPRT